MAEYIESILETVGRTPIVRLSRYGRAASCAGQIFAKVESFNPGGSVKDRVALNMIETAEKEGLLTPGGTIIEPTSGNTGVGLALVGATRGYKVILTMPETMSVERRKLLAALGAEIVLTPGQQGMKGAIAEAERLRDTIDGSVILGQFVNPANPAVHYNVTAPEVFDAIDGRIDFFVAGVGTGGTISGIGRYLRERIPRVGIVAVEPADSPVISGGTPGPHAIQGIGAGFIPATFDSSVVTEVVRVTTDEAFGAARLLARTEGILAGISSGAALHAATA
ncbi:MAG: cysteine synthase A, partial [Duncaniella sp.]|nr:cysteine synthase A [Duncaniella sp.]